VPCSHGWLITAANMDVAVPWSHGWLRTTAITLTVISESPQRYLKPSYNNANKDVGVPWSHGWLRTTADMDVSVSRSHGCERTAAITLTVISESPQRYLKPSYNNANKDVGVPCSHGWLRTAAKGRKVCSPFRHALEIGEPENRAKNWIPNIA